VARVAARADVIDVTPEKEPPAGLVRIALWRVEEVLDRAEGARVSDQGSARPSRRSRRRLSAI
jgi:hypothetical protein